MMKKIPNSGRQKGTPNKKTLILSDFFESAGLNVPEKLIQILPELDPSRKADILLELMNYLYPKRKAIEHTGLNEGPIEIFQTQFSMNKVLENKDAVEHLIQLEKITNEQNRNTK